MWAAEASSAVASAVDKGRRGEVWGKTALPQPTPTQGKVGPGEGGRPRGRSQMARGKSCLQDVLAVLGDFETAPQPL